MSVMEPSTNGQPPVHESARTDITDTFKTARAPSDRHFEQLKVPGVGSGPILPEWLSKRLQRTFRRKHTSATQ
jgi:hypothetical protein